MVKIKKEAIPLRKVDSSNIWGAGYDIQTKTLRVRFRNGSEYLYSDVPEHRANAILTGEEVVNGGGVMQHISVGSYFNRQIVGNYVCKKIKGMDGT